MNLELTNAIIDTEGAGVYITESTVKMIKVRFTNLIASDGVSMHSNISYAVLQQRCSLLIA